ncbi:hypothetical protein STIAU_4901, partial [Stigmatella aurantiaca DW4/3-1]
MLNHMVEYKERPHPRQRGRRRRPGSRRPEGLQGGDEPVRGQGVEDVPLAGPAPAGGGHREEEVMQVLLFVRIRAHHQLHPSLDGLPHVLGLEIQPGGFPVHLHHHP